MSLRKVAALAATALVVGFLAGFVATRGGTKLPYGRLTVEASGTSLVRPDEAELTLGATVTETTADKALTRLAGIAQHLRRLLAAEGFAAPAIRTSALSVNPVYGPNGTLTGYQAGENFTLTTRRLTRLGAVLTAAVDAGANQVENVSFLTSDPEAGGTSAVEAALAVAHRRAIAEAKALGVTLGPVLAVSSTLLNPAAPIIPHEGWMNFQGAAAPLLPVPSGAVHIQASVRVTYAFR